MDSGATAESRLRPR